MPPDARPVPPIRPHGQPRPGRPAAAAPAPARLDQDSVRAAYRRMAAVYDLAFGGVTAMARRRAVAAANALPGARVLEVGVGTGLALPLYDPAKRVTGIDLSADMLARARTRAAQLPHVEALLERDAEQTGLPDAGFDIAVAMFVATVVPDPARLLAELKRVVAPGGTIIFVNHFSARGGPRLAVERAMAPLARALGWHPDFPIASLLPPADQARARIKPVPPAGLFSLVQLTNLAPVHPKVDPEAHPEAHPEAGADAGAHAAPPHVTEQIETPEPPAAPGRSPK